MKEKQAREEGLQYTGIYSHDKDEVKQRAAAIREKGYRAVVVTIPSNPLSRGRRGDGYSVYTEVKFQKDESAESIRKTMSFHAACVAEMQKRHAEEMAKLEAQNTANAKWLTDNGYTL